MFRGRSSVSLKGCGAATDLGLEGVVGKKLNSAYHRGRNRLWLKVRAGHGAAAEAALALA